ncbi:hypothetical protein CPB84DRAFT_1329544 [Gymnopilus junonius]|uniref:Uncharacterized protein n=1 Tax=Gymnopilus junonius TaxID=109634 RepID=A0A9P5N8R1_GYMJU|nr:hypothetical protein CPB84DRAFT_1329544 [Gymnopilus junonius]
MPPDLVRSPSRAFHFVHTLDTSNFPAYLHFALLHVRIHHDMKGIDKAALDIINIFPLKGSKAPLGSPYDLCFPEWDTEKLKIFSN